MKKLTIIAGLVLSGLLGLAVTGCGDKGSSSQSSTLPPEPEPTLEAVQVDPYTLSANYRNLRINGNGYSGEQFTEHRNTEGKKTYAIENVKALVVPVDFTDYTYERFGNTEDEVREKVRKIMFGTQEEMLADYTAEEIANGIKPWHSLSSYYESTSFGKCHISGTVAPFFHTGRASTYYDKTKTAESKNIVIQIQDYYRDPDHGINLADYDANHDGYVDSIIMLYTAPITTTGELWWAFCWSVSGAYGKYTPDGTLEGANRFFWASFNFFYEYYNEPAHKIDYHSAADIKAGTVHADAHTMIHEYGHVLSLPDYYVTDYATNDYSALGGADMMDNNVGDHNAYSKILYGWINPRRIDGTEGSITLTMNSTTTTGDTIIIPAPGEWNNTYLDQYVMIEFLTPEGVGVLDGETPYLTIYPRYYSKAGIRITHVDSRMGVFTSTSSGYEFAGYTWATTTSLERSYVTIAADNTASDSCFPKYKQIEVLPRDGRSMKYQGTAEADDWLFNQGDVFGATGCWDNFKLNGQDGSQEKEFGFKISVDAINGNTSATITISR